MKELILFCRSLILFTVLLGFLCTVCFCEKTKKSVEEDSAENNDDTESMDSPVESATSENKSTRVPCARRQNKFVHEITAAEPRKYPFIAAIMSPQNEYLCCGTVVSQSMVLTTATCVQQPIGHVLLNVTKDKGDIYAVLLHIVTTEKFPTFDGGETTKDVGIIYIDKHNASVASNIRLSNYTSARNLVEMTAIGFGLNAEVGKTRVLQSVGVEHKPAYDIGDLLRGYFDCIDTKVPSCFRDIGGPVIFDNELVGIVTKGQQECTKEMTSEYSISKILVEVLPSYVFRTWLDSRISRHEADQKTSDLKTYPVKPSTARKNENLNVMSLKSVRNSGTKYKPTLQHSFLFIVFIITNSCTILI